ncbi:MAG: hypothetical protein WKG03_21650 [Telluria sp.]
MGLKLDQMTGPQQGLLLFVVLGSIWGYGQLSGNADRVAEQSQLDAEAKVRSAAPAPIDTSRNYTARDAAVAKFTGMPAITYAEWLDGDFVLSARENGSSWQSVADAACAWIREQGMQGPFAVIIIESAASKNKRWEQLARARCN